MPLDLDGIVGGIKGVFADLGLLATVTHEPHSGLDSYGEPQYGASVSRQVAMTHGVRWLQRPGMEQQMSTMQIAILENVTVTMEDRFTLPDGSQPQIMNIKAPEISTGHPITEVWF